MGKTKEDQKQPRVGSRRQLSFPTPANDKKKAAKAKEPAVRVEEDTSPDNEKHGDNREEDGEEEILDTSSVHEAILERVQKAMEGFEMKTEEAGSPLMKGLIPMLVTAVTMAVTDSVKVGVKQAVLEMNKSQKHGKTSVNERRLMTAVTRLTYENDRLAQYTRRESLRIHGVKVQEQESAMQVEEKVIKIFADAGVEVKEDDIQAVHRAGRPRGGFQAILVKFVSRRKRREIMQKKKALKGKAGYERVFINDDLTPLRAKLLGEVKRLDGIDRAWTVDGKIHCVKKVPVGMPPPRPIFVETPDDLHRELGAETVNWEALGLSHLLLNDDDE